MNEHQHEGLKTLDYEWRRKNPRKIGAGTPSREKRIVPKPERPSKSEEYGLN